MISFRVDSKWNATGLGDFPARRRLEELEQVIDRQDNALVNGNTNKMSAVDRATHTQLLEEAKKEYAAIPKAIAVGEGKVGDLEVFLRGNHLARTAVASAIPNDPGWCQPAAAELREKRAAGTGTLDHRPAAPAHRSRDCKPRVALAFRPGPGAVGRQLRQARATPLEPGASGLAGHSVHRRRMVLEGAPQANSPVTGLPDEHRTVRPGCFARPGEPVALAYAVGEWRPKYCALATSNERATQHDDGRNANGIHTLRESVGHRNGTQPKALSIVAAECLSPRASRAPSTSSSRRSTFPIRPCRTAIA